MLIINYHLLVCLLFIVCCCRSWCGQTPMHWGVAPWGVRTCTTEMAVQRRTLSSLCATMDQGNKFDPNYILLCVLIVIPFSWPGETLKVSNLTLLEVPSARLVHPPDDTVSTNSAVRNITISQLPYSNQCMLLFLIVQLGTPEPQQQSSHKSCKFSSSLSYFLYYSAYSLLTSGLWCSWME